MEVREFVKLLVDVSISQLNNMLHSCSSNNIRPLDMQGYMELEMVRHMAENVLCG
jgi:hypothetical protein